jgi:hypothetical protein
LSTSDAHAKEINKKVTEDKIKRFLIIDRNTLCCHSILKMRKPVDSLRIRKTKKEAKY